MKQLHNPIGYIDRGGDRVETRKQVQRKNVPQITNKVTLQVMMRRNNPYNEPVGILTGRCHMCGSEEVWAQDHPNAVGCNGCGFRYPA